MAITSQLRERVLRSARSQSSFRRDGSRALRLLQNRGRRRKHLELNCLMTKIARRASSRCQSPFRQFTNTIGGIFYLATLQDICLTILRLTTSKLIFRRRSFLALGPHG